MYLNEDQLTGDFASCFSKLCNTCTCEELLEKIQSNLTDQEIQEWTNTLTDSKIRINVDGTYLNHVKPTDPVMNRSHYSLHKKTHLTKAVIYCSTSGFICQV